jgi:F-type H+-transporting ATPase subunit b
MLKEAQSTRAELINTAKEEAQQEADKILTQAQEAIQNEKRAAIKELREQVGSLAMDIAGKVLQKELDNKDKQVELIDQLIQDSDLK